MVVTDPSTSAATTDEDVDVVVTSAGWSAEDGQISISGFVPGIVEEGGVCSAVLSGPARLSVQTDAVPDAGSTQCGVLILGSDEVGPGTYSVVLSYRSNAYSGNSETIEVEVP